MANTTPTGGGSSTDYEAFCYDGAGNRTKYYTAAGASCSTSNPAVTYTYDGANAMTNTIAGSGAPALSGSGFSYDGNGNQTSAKSFPGRTVTYNDRDAATSTTPHGGSAVASTYAAAGNLERLTAGSATFRPSALSPAPASSTTSGTTTWTVRDPNGELLAIRVGGSGNPAAATSYYALSDQVDSVRFLVKSDGSVANSYAYSAFGVAKSATEAVANPYRYAGAYLDTNSTGLYKMGARYYDPSSGRFTQPDPSGQEANAYAYAGGSPITYFDPSGLATVGERVTAKVLARAAFFAGGIAGAAIGFTVGAALGVAPPADIAVGGVGAAIGAYVGSNCSHDVVEDAYLASVDGEEYGIKEAGVSCALALI